MKAVAYQKPAAITDELALLDITLPDPQPQGRDLLVEVRAVSVNPVDTKVRASRAAAGDDWVVLGWDAAGIVRTVGPDVTLFKPGDRVWYAGDLRRAGSNAELQLVDERIVGHMPQTLDFAAAASLPLTGITAWELLFDRLQLPADRRSSKDRLLIIGAAGGVGSVLVQLARQLTGLTIIGTASRPETRDWVSQNGAHYVIDHTLPLLPQLQALGYADVSHVISLTHTEQHFAAICELIAPQGKLALIDDPAEVIDIRKLKAKSISLHWELMFTRSLFATEDMLCQHELLDELATLVDAGTVRATQAEHFGRINATNLRRAHALLESGKARGKIVLEGFEP
ncbi:zinc-binding alcohol dehydrogenase family protein [Chitinilyticum piscinae]|uniref:Zinc-type alcohol dehydrogenase-like protein n=1 Tax=Chitinilyticum piscinae TaxID=2866724 RepID=A0A8J7FGM4_9NEIS|nr:zinc-binding alcohol dehydrogenase family protein [Chitinilyticum piscinae]MBE9608785.1 zinc-binding alcohol dehydrogenase family protein [Chitinilyticum piscinae]